MNLEIREYVLNNPDKNSYTLMKEIESKFGVKLNYSSIHEYRKRQARIQNELLEYTNNKEMNLEEFFEMIQKGEKSLFQRYWETTLASAVVDWYKDRKKRKASE